LRQSVSLKNTLFPERAAPFNSEHSLALFVRLTKRPRTRQPRLKQPASRVVPKRLCFCFSNAERKAKVESDVLLAERCFIAALRNRKFFSFEELNQAIVKAL